MLDINSKQIMAAKYSNGVYPDHYGACDLLEKINFKYAIKALYADRACDRQKLYKLCHKFGIKTKIPTQNNAVEHLKLNYMSDRNAAIKRPPYEKVERERMIEKYFIFFYGKRAYIEGFSHD